MLKYCPKDKTQMVKIKRGQVVNLANPYSKIPPSSDWLVCQNCDHKEKA